MAGSSKKAIYGAIIANTGIAIAKFTASFFTGSASMLSEGIHSLVDTGNGILLLYGIKRSKKPATENHPFGFGNEIFFWSFIVAMLIFALGGGIALYEGIIHVQHPTELKNPIWNYSVLIVALIFEGAALRVALKSFKANNDQGFIQNLRASKDSSTVAIIIEDMAATVGLAIALICLILSQLTGIAQFDGIGSILIGILLLSVSWFFAIECKGLLIGEGLTPNQLEKITEILDKHPEVEEYRKPLSLYFGPNEVLVNIDVDFQDALSSEEIEKVVDQVERQIKSSLPQVNRIYIEAEKLIVSSKRSSSNRSDSSDS